MTKKLENSTIAIVLEKVFSFQSQIRVMSKNVQTTVQVHSFQKLAR